MRKSLLVLISHAVITSCRPAPVPELWVIPKGYVGWLRLDYAVANAPPLSLENGKYLVRPIGNHRVRTSSTNDTRVDQNDYMMEGPTGGQRLVFSTTPTSGYAVQNAYTVRALNAPTARFECVFVGTRVDFKANHEDCSHWADDQSSPPLFRKPGE